MIIDDHIHVHEWSFQPGQAEYEVDYVIGLMDQFGIDKGIIMDSLAYIGTDQTVSNDETLKAVKAHPDRLIGFANIKPQTGLDACRAEIDRTVGNWGFRGIKLHPAVDQYPANDARLVHPIIAIAIEYDIPVWFHTGHQPYATATLLGNLASTFPEAKIVCGHMAHGMFYDAICAARRHPTLYLEISHQGSHSFAAACQEVGPDRLIFGSDAPYASPGSIKRMVENSPLSPEDKANILGHNIARLIRFNIPG